MFRSSLRHLAKPNVVVLGTGWAGCYALHRLDPQLCNMQSLSTRNHMLFTPLLPQTTTGSLEFRSVCEPVNNIQPALAHQPSNFSRSTAYDVDFKEQIVKCVGVGVVGATQKVTAQPFTVKYDYLVLAHGAAPNTFNIPGVHEHAFFLREVGDARGIRQRLMQNIMTAGLPSTSPEEAKRLLHTIVVGGGPTGIEFAANLADFFREDVKRVNESLVKYCKVSILEGGEVLGMFDKSLQKYGQQRLETLRVEVIKTSVVGVTETSVTTKSGQVLPTGLVVWSTGVGPTPMTKFLDCDKTNRGRISVDDHLRVLKDGKPIPNVFAGGDCAANNANQLPTLAAVASRQGDYIGTLLNHLIKDGALRAPFNYKSLGSMVSIGNRSAIVSLTPAKKLKLNIKGLKALWVWKSSYITILGTIRSKLYVVVNWSGSKIFGRDVTYVGDLCEDHIFRTAANEEIARQLSKNTAPPTDKKE